MEMKHIHSLARWVRSQYTGGGTDQFVGLLNRAARRYQEWNGKTLSLEAIRKALGEETSRMRYERLAKLTNPYVQLTLF